ncbi:hypothetical protein BKA70DRAFT_236183 [Coprinopsis sp. MPI-PUGE-AT-0042]|nr:hypothetical protein BKA70DRAFT_236183 [Coprinopsis sp. MPI-PUGE-AT-0042]
MTEPRLPAELLRSVIEQLRGDTQSLATASLSSSQIRAYCQELLFSEVLVDFAYLHRLEDLLQCFKSTPSLLRHVKSVTVDMGYGLDLNHENPDLLPDILGLLGSLPLQYFSLITVPSHWRIDLPRLPAVQSALEKLSRSPTLTSLSLLGTPIQWVSLRCPALESLSLSIIWNNSWMSSPTDSIAGAQRCHLRALSIDYDPVSFAFALDSTNRIHLGNLRRLAIRHTHSAIPPNVDLGPLLSACAQSLETLECNSAVMQSSGQISSLLRQLVSLRIIQITCASVYYDENMNRQNPYAQWLPILLRTTAPVNLLEATHFELVYSEESEISQDKDFWFLIDELLADQAHFPRLRLISIRIQVEEPQQMPQTTLSLEEDFFPIYRSSGRGFKFSHSVA